MLRTPTLLLVALMVGCTDTAPGDAEVDVAECSGDNDVDDNTLIVWDFKESAHEMITCGGLTFQLIGALIDSAQAFMEDPNSLPSAFSYDSGLYHTAGTGVAMDLWFLAGSGSPVGTAGEPIDVNLFDPDSFFVGMDLTDNGDNTVTLTFDEPGPLAALLGRGDNPDSPQLLTDADAAVLSTNLLTLELAGSVFVDDVRTVSTISYELSNPAQALSETLSGMRLDMRQVSASGAREDLGQDLSTPVWDVEYGDIAGTLDGTIELDVVDGPFDFHALLEYYPIDIEPAITITCL